MATPSRTPLADPAAAAGKDQEREGRVAVATVTVEPRKVRVGDRIRLSASSAGMENERAVTTEEIKPGAKLGPFRIVDADVSHPRELILTLTPDETGAIEIPAFEATFRGSGGAERKVQVPAQSISVAALLGDADATLADIRPPAEMSVPWPWGAIALALAGTALAAAGLYALRRWLKKPRRSAAVPEQALPPGVTPDAWALGELEKLLAGRLAEAGKMREFHIELADLVRRYLELRFRIPAQERTTEEVGEELRGAQVEAEIGVLTADLLTRCDRVKFAKHVPELLDAAQSVVLARLIIARSVPAPAPAAPPREARAEVAAGESAA